MTLVGDEPVPFALRPEVRALYAEQDPVESLRGHVAIGLVLLGLRGWSGERYVTWAGRAAAAPCSPDS